VGCRECGDEPSGSGATELVYEDVEGSGHDLLKISRKQYVM
jgi:hypothetical protein